MSEDPYQRSPVHVPPSFYVRLWSINRVLQFTGFRLGVYLPANLEGPISIGLSWYGFKNFGTWKGRWAK